MWIPQSELPLPIPWNSVESGIVCTSRIYFDNVMLALYKVTMTSKKPCQHNNKCDAAKFINFINSIDKNVLANQNDGF